MSDSGLHLHLAAVLRRRLATIAIAAGAGLLLGYWVAMALPNYYRSSATIFVATREINQRLQESGDAPFDLGIGLRSMTARILSREWLSDSIDDLHLYQQQRESKALPREAALARMRSSIDVVPVEAGIAAADAFERAAPDTFSVSFTHRDPRLAAEVAQRLAEAFVKEYIDERVGRARKEFEAVEAEFARQSDEYRSAEARIAVFKAANAGRLPEDRMTNQRMLDQGIDELRQAQRARERARSDEDFWDAEALAAAALSDPGDEVELERRLQRLELQVAEFRARGFTDRHPGLIRAQRELRELRDRIEADTGIPQQPRRANTAYQNAEAQRKQAMLEVEIRAREVTRLEARVDLLEQRLAAMPEVAEKLSALNAASKQISRDLGKLADRRVQASLHADVESGQLSEQFRILEAALPANQPSSPDRLEIILIGLIFGIGCGVAVAGIAEANDDSLRAARDAKSAFQIPVLAAIPDILLEADQIVRRRRSLRNALAVSLVAVFCLTGGAVTYVYVNGMPGWLRAALEAHLPDGRIGAAGAKAVPVQPLSSRESTRSSQVPEI